MKKDFYRIEIHTSGVQSLFRQSLFRLHTPCYHSLALLDLITSATFIIFPSVSIKHRKSHSNFHLRFNFPASLKNRGENEDNQVSAALSLQKKRRKRLCKDTKYITYMHILKPSTPPQLNLITNKPLPHLLHEKKWIHWTRVSNSFKS